MVTYEDFDKEKIKLERKHSIERKRLNRIALTVLIHKMENTLRIFKKLKCIKATTPNTDQKEVFVFMKGKSIFDFCRSVSENTWDEILADIHATKYELKNYYISPWKIKCNFDIDYNKDIKKNELF